MSSTDPDTAEAAADVDGGVIYDALTLDTQVFSAESYDLDGPLLSVLRTLKGGPARIVMSQVVVSEIRGHMTAEILKARSGLDTAVRRAVLFGLRRGDEAGLAPIEVDAKALAEGRLRAYLDEIDAELVSADLITIGELMSRYFSGAPPFAATGKKKAEFPDAIALYTLEVWAKKHRKRILAVSNDGDWKSFAEKSDYIDVEEDLETGLARLQEQAADAKLIVAQQLEAIESGVDGDLTQQFTDALASAISSAHVSADAESYLLVDAEHVELEVADSTFKRGSDGAIPFRLVQANANELTASVDLAVSVTASGDFNFSVYDSIDKDHVSLGGAHVTKEMDLDVTVLVSFFRDAEAGWTIEDIEPLAIPDPISFGYIEPDWSGDE